MQEIRFSGCSYPWFTCPGVDICAGTWLLQVPTSNDPVLRRHHSALRSVQLIPPNNMSKPGSYVSNGQVLSRYFKPRNPTPIKLTSNYSPPLSVRFRGFVDSAILFLGLYVTTLFSVCCWFLHTCHRSTLTLAGSSMRTRRARHPPTTSTTV